MTKQLCFLSKKFVLNTAKAKFAYYEDITRFDSFSFRNQSHPPLPLLPTHFQLFSLLITMLTTLYLIFPFNFHFHINFLWFKFLFSVHYLVVDVAALQFVGPSTWMYNLTANVLTLLFLIYFIFIFSHYLVVDVAALQFVGPSTCLYNLTPNILALLFLIYYIFMFLHYLVVDVAALQFLGPSTWVYNLTPNILTYITF